MAANQQLEGWVKCTGIPGGVGGFPSAFNLSVTVSAIQGNTTITIGTSSVYYTINIQTNNYSIYADSATVAQSSTYNGTGATNVLVSLRGGWQHSPSTVPKSAPSQRHRPRCTVLSWV